MKTLIKSTVLSAAMTLALGNAAWADDHKECSDSTLRGLYIFNATGYNIADGVPVPKAIVEFILSLIHI